MPTATITSKGQVTIPKKVRDQLGLQAGDILSFDVESVDKIIIRPEKKILTEPTVFSIVKIRKLFRWRRWKAAWRNISKRNTNPDERHRY